MDCVNGATEYLFYGGIIIIATNVVGLLAGCARQAALKVIIKFLSFEAPGTLSRVVDGE